MQTIVKATLASADLAMRDGEPTAARQAVDAAVERATRWLADRPDAAERLVLLASARQNRGALLAATVGVDEAITEWTAALDPARAAAAAGAEAGRRLHGTLLLRLSSVAYARGDRDGARAWFRQALATGITREQVAAMPGVASLFDSPDFRDLLPASPHAK
jgi:tetratricopeptide (TPR) repeat protein